MGLFKKIKEQSIGRIDPNYHIGMRVVKTALSVAVCLALSLLLNYDPGIAQISAVSAIVTLRTSNQDTLRSGLFRVIGTVFGGLLGLVCVIISQFLPYYYDGLFIIVIPLMLIVDLYVCNLLKMQDLCSISCVVIILVAVRFDAHEPMNEAMKYTVFRLSDTLIGVVVATAVNYLSYARAKKSAEKEIKTLKKALIVVDYQVDFVTGSLGFDDAAKIEENICAKIDSFRNEGADLIFTLDTHTKEYLETAEGKNLPIIHCVEGEEGHKLYGKVAERFYGCKSFNKAAFGSIELADYLKEMDYAYVELCGVVSNICVMSNAVLAKAALPEAEIKVDAACSASNDPELQAKAYDIMRNLHIGVING